MVFFSFLKNGFHPTDIAIGNTWGASPVRTCAQPR
jgi:hypothetical protein